jgi:LysM repeat protein
VETLIQIRTLPAAGQWISFEDFVESCGHPLPVSVPERLPPSRLSAKIASMKRFALCSSFFLIAAMIGPMASAQAPSGDRSDAAMLETLARKIDLQNAKIDTLSRQILKLEQQLSAIRPGVMIGETPAPGSTETPKPPQTGNSHVVAKGETLTSIAKMHKVTVEELQKFNHIENDRKLQIGQTIMIPPPPSSTASSPTPAPPNG